MARSARALAFTGPAVVVRPRPSHNRRVNEAPRISAIGAAPEHLLEAIARRGDRTAFAELFRRFAPKIKAYMMRLGTGDALAEDLAQDVMLTVWKRAALFDAQRASVGTWIFSIARNRRIDVSRKDGRIEFEADDPALVTDDDDTAFHHLASAQDMRRVKDAMSALPEDQAQVVRLSFYEDKAHSEIAQELGLPLGTVKSRIRLAMDKLRVALGDAR